MKKFLAVFISVLLSVICTAMLSACGEKQYSLTVNGSEFLYAELDGKYKAGEEVAVKVKINPYEGVKASLDSEALVKTKSEQDDFWLFNFEMPSHDATLNIASFKGFDEPLLCGFYLTFKDKNGSPIEALNKDLESNDAIADYFILQESNGVNTYTTNVGADVFADRNHAVGDIKLELEDTLYFTHELLGAQVNVGEVYLDKNTQKVSACVNYADYQLSSSGNLLAHRNQQLSDVRFGQNGLYEEKFDSEVKLAFKFIDYLTGVKALEYNSDNELVKSTEIAKAEGSVTHTAGANCEYVIIEETYTDINGGTYCERVLINKSERGETRILKYPRGNGLITPVALSISW